MKDTCNLYHETVNFILNNSVLLLFEYQFKQDRNRDIFKHTVIVTKTNVLTSTTTLFQRYDYTGRQRGRLYLFTNVINCYHLCSILENPWTAFLITNKMIETDTLLT